MAGEDTVGSYANSRRISQAYRFSLMVLCPFVYILMRFDSESLALQPSEVHSAHWVSLRALMSPHLNTSISSDVSGRFGRTDSRLTRSVARLLFGRILIKAINLIPSESVYCNSSSEFLPATTGASSHQSSLISLLPFAKLSWQNPSEKLILWGLTLGKRMTFRHMDDCIINFCQGLCRTSSGCFPHVTPPNCGRGQLCLLLTIGLQSGSALMPIVSKKHAKWLWAVRRIPMALPEVQVLGILTIPLSPPSRLDLGKKSKTVPFSRCLVATMTEQRLPSCLPCY